LDERGLPWNDPDIGIQWPLEGLDPVLSDRDREWLPLGKTEDADLPAYAP
jgi:dTDP-4-dehydrorhamnose 3,5-epimerase